MARGRAPTMVLYLAMFATLLQMCGAQDIQCTAIQGGGETTYRVPEFTATDCQYSWTNRIGIVLANYEDNTDKLVVRKSNTTLTITGCSELINYERDCISEGMHRKAICNTTCNGDVDPFQQVKVFTQEYWPVFVVLVLVLLLLLGIVLCCRFRTQIFRSCLYTAVKMENDPPSAAAEATGVTVV